MKGPTHSFLASSSEEFVVSVEVEVPVGEGGLKARKSGIGIMESGLPGGPLMSPTSGKNLAVRRRVRDMRSGRTCRVELE